ncbi:hypothetical protein [Pelobacter propionicus]|uniref:Uncharacterized protein n=1 Tax=Pelobacter propionicus (strain DSM 2379 / NBRC 103807 / OttBd1) TaxID=338966 RepID=A1AMP8_PELPD|nr:hypothetical protein [Pelobacter propionicus]ABK98618.1 conserved hypothetical protein [Pelobacter propionicus DSM 2379]
MKPIVAGQDGFALVTSLLMTFISLVMVMAIMYMISRNIEMMGGMKRYKTALEAGQGGTEIVVKEIIPEILKNYTDADLITKLQSAFNGVTLTVLADKECLKDKITKDESEWDASYSRSLNPKVSPDFTLKLTAAQGQPYSVYTKIVDTVLGNTDMSGLQLEGAGVAESLTVITPQHLPYVYRVEVQAERETNAHEQANISVLYAY